MAIADAVYECVWQGGMLTTFGDWLKWNAMLDSRSMGAPLVEALETTGVLNGGRKITYALGVVVTNENGQRKVAHGGSTAGYQTFLSRYPDLKLSIAVMCNGSSRNPSALERDIFNEIAGPFPAPTPPATIAMKPEELQKYVGLWRNEKTHMPERTMVESGALRLAGQAVLRPLPDGSFQSGSTKIRFQMGTNGKPISVEVDTGEAITRYIAETQWTPTPNELMPLAGIWHSDEADASFTIAVENDKAFFVQRPDTRLQLRPQFKDHFSVGIGQVLWVTRDANGQITKLHVGAGRMRDMPFERVGGK